MTGRKDIGMGQFEPGMTPWLFKQALCEGSHLLLDSYGVWGWGGEGTTVTLAPC